MVWWCGRHVQLRRLLFAVEQRASLVNVKLKWVKDRALDSVVARERHLRPALQLLERISSDPSGRASAYDLSRRRRQLGLGQARVAAFLRRFPALFGKSTTPSTCGRGPWFQLTDDALRLRQEELQILRDYEPDLVDRLRRLLMLTIDRCLPLHTVDQLRWDMGLPPDYHQTLIPRYPHFFELVHPPGDERVWLKLLSWDPSLAVSELQKCSIAAAYGGGGNGAEDCLAFPVSFTRGFGLKRKCLAWLQEWQTLPYTSPYTDASGLDPRTDVSEKRIVGVFHELLHLTLGKKTDRRNVSNLRKPLALPQKFTKVFERHPGIFYLSPKLATQTVVLREAYGGGRELLSEHPLVGIRRSYAAMMREGMLERSRGSSNKEMGEVGTDEEDNESDGYDSYRGESEETCGFEFDSVSEDIHDESVGAPHS